ncbi:hypothetical protein HID58_056534 [Brassica napus]|uniref:Uncharacterized protein n=1 Tax=Brassica napus TaxID=3708 RepID=A0ABQ8ANK1_BRANA|nr:hypothetical protein HID58_056531 [Brassica napus]KAH0894105.1 hypothetical protein HID58_056534 [Brassica napus]
MDYTSRSNRLCRRQAKEAEFFFHLIRNQRLPSSRGTSSIAEPGLLILAPLYLSFCSIEHNYIFFSWTLRDHEEFKVKINVLVETAPTFPEEV